VTVNARVQHDRSAYRREPSPRCRLCEATGEEVCDACAQILTRACWDGVLLGAVVSSTLGFALSFVLAISGGTLVWLAGLAVFLGPFAWAAGASRKSGACSRDRAAGIALGHAGMVILNGTILLLAAAVGGSP
jgi:hypothetical protein